MESEKGQELTAGQRRSRENLIPFKPGVSGNPSGGRKGVVSLTARVLEVLSRKDDSGRTNAHIIAEAIIEESHSGKGEILKELWSRVDGKMTEKHEISGPEGGPIHSVVDTAKRLMQTPDTYAESLKLSERLRGLPDKGSSVAPLSQNGHANGQNGAAH